MGLNFAHEEEAKRFHGHVIDLLGKRQRKSGTDFLLLPTCLHTDPLTEKHDMFGKFRSCVQNDNNSDAERFKITCSNRRLIDVVGFSLCAFFLRGEISLSTSYIF